MCCVTPLARTTYFWRQPFRGNILTLQRILGHGSLTMTMHYAHLAPEHLQQANNLNPLARLNLVDTAKMKKLEDLAKLGR